MSECQGEMMEGGTSTISRAARHRLMVAIWDLVGGDGDDHVVVYL